MDSDRLLTYDEILVALKLKYEDTTEQMFLVGHCQLSNIAQDAKTAAYYEGIMAQENQVLIKKIEDTFPFLTTHKCEIAICEADNKPCCEQATYCGYYKWLIIKQEIGDGK
jgi:hypothetical protein